MDLEAVDCLHWESVVLVFAKTQCLYKHKIRIDGFRCYIGHDYKARHALLLQHQSLFQSQEKSRIEI